MDPFFEEGLFYTKRQKQKPIDIPTLKLLKENKPIRFGYTKKEYSNGNQEVRVSVEVLTDFFDFLEHCYVNNFFTEDYSFETQCNGEIISAIIKKIDNDILISLSQGSVQTPVRLGNDVTTNYKILIHNMLDNLRIELPDGVCLETFVNYKDPYVSFPGEAVLWQEWISNNQDFNDSLQTVIKAFVFLRREYLKISVMYNNLINQLNLDEKTATPLTYNIHDEIKRRFSDILSLRYKSFRRSLKSAEKRGDPFGLAKTINLFNQSNPIYGMYKRRKYIANKATSRIKGF